MEMSVILMCQRRGWRKSKKKRRKTIGLEHSRIMQLICEE